MAVQGCFIGVAVMLDGRGFTVAHYGDKDAEAEVTFMQTEFRLPCHTDETWESFGRFAECSFGASPGLVPPVSADDGPAARWAAAVAAGGIGRYAVAATLLADLARDAGWRSAAASTRASHVRQLGGHTAAAALDGAALLAAREPWQAADALTGLVADDLGRGRIGAARRCLTRLDAALDELDPAAGWFGAGRLRLRREWVATELALVAGDREGAARGAAALVAASDASCCPSLRHRVKSELIVAAVRAGEPGAAGRAEAVLGAARRAGQRPLEWASLLLAAGVVPGGAHEYGWAAGELEAGLRR